MSYSIVKATTVNRLFFSSVQAVIAVNIQRTLNSTVFML